MSKKKFRYIFLWCMAMVIISGCQQASGHKTAYLAHNLPISHPVHKGMEVLAEELAKRSDGKFTIQIFPDGQLGAEREVLELLQIGSIAMTKVSSAAMANFAPEYKVFGLPYLFRDSSHFFNVLEGTIGQNILAGGSDYLLKGLCFYDAGSRSFYTKTKPVITPSDLKGMKIRVMNDQMSVDMVNAMGASATPMAYGELYTAIQQGVVDGAENNPPSFVTSRHYEVCKYYSLDEHSMLPDVLVIGIKYWNTLNDQEKEWLTTSAKISADAQKIFWADNVRESMKILKDAGVQIKVLDKQLFAEKASSVLQKFNEDPTMKKLVDSIIQHQ
ncbi:MAG: TRAP transporter substrate-binding protein [Saprospiraceae bacterium]